MKPIDKVLTLIYHNVTEPAGTDWTQDGNRKTKCEIGFEMLLSLAGEREDKPYGFLMRVI